MSRYRQVKLWALDKGAYYCDAVGAFLHKPGDVFYGLASKMSQAWHEERRKASP